MTGRCTLVPSHASPSSSGVTATGEKAVAGLLWKKPKPLPSSAGIRLRRLTSLTSMISRMRSRPRPAPMPIRTSSVMTATSASRSMPHSSDSARIGSRGPMKLSDPPWYMSGIGPEGWRHLGAARLAHQLHVIDVGRAVGPLIRAGQGRGAPVGVELEGVRGAAGVQRCRQLRELRRLRVPVVQHGLQVGRDLRGRDRVLEISADDDQLAVTATGLEGCKFHDRLLTADCRIGCSAACRADQLLIFHESTYADCSTPAGSGAISTG